MLIATIPVWEKALCLLLGVTLYGAIKVMDYYVEKDRKEAQAQ